MPRTEHNIGRQRSTRYEICTNGLLTLRGRQLQALRLGTDPNAQANIEAIDRVLIDVIGYTGNIAEESRDFRRTSTFRRGELRRAVADVLRKADRPLTTLEVAKAVLEPRGVEVSYARKHKARVTNVLAVLKVMAGEGRVAKTTNRQGNLAWSFAPL
ncbi:hypothetical protein ACFQ14_10740 [Pseudahrensia aquimaris]|uniref:Uncharacterized protein n=1 Tax=Pseudahrensia aquimaris TaxID=744461 RepID=A0ABW3FGP5_9HYPH